MNNMIRNHKSYKETKTIPLKNQNMIDSNIKNELIEYLQENEYIHPSANKWFELYSNILTNPQSIKKNSKDGITTVSYGNKQPSINDRFGTFFN